VAKGEKRVAKGEQLWLRAKAEMQVAMEKRRVGKREREAYG
jgi:hypothetical protein